MMNEDDRTEKEKRSWSARCGHISKKLFNDEPLKGKTKIFALELLSLESYKDDECFIQIHHKITNNELLTDYEKSMMEDVVLTNSKLFGEK